MADATPPTKLLDPCALATLCCGTMLCESFSTVHEAAEHLLGHPVWTHEFIEPETKQALIRAALAVCPDLPTEKVEDWQATRAAVRTQYGETVEVPRGNRERSVGALVTLARVIK